MVVDLRPKVVRIIESGPSPKFRVAYTQYICFIRCYEENVILTLCFVFDRELTACWLS